MIAAVVASVSGSEAVLLALGLVLLVVTVVIMIGPHSYVLYSIFITPTVVLFTSTSIADVTATDAQRVGFTLIGSALILLASGITLGWRRGGRRRAAGGRRHARGVPGRDLPARSAPRRGVRGAGCGCTRTGSGTISAIPGRHASAGNHRSARIESDPRCNRWSRISGYSAWQYLASRRSGTAGMHLGCSREWSYSMTPKRTLGLHDRPRRRFRSPSRTPVTSTAVRAMGGDLRSVLRV